MEMSNGRNEQLEELFPFYALGVLSADEEESIEAYVGLNWSANARLQEEIETVGMLAISTTPVMPSSTVKQSLMAQVREEKATRVTPPREMISVDSGSSKWWQGWLMPAFSLATLLTLLTFGWNTSLRTQLDKANNNITILQEELQEQEKLIYLSTATELKTVSISLLNAEAVPTGQFIFDENNEEGVLLVSGLEPLADDQTYQFWVADISQTINGGIFEINEFGIGIVAIDGTAFPLDKLDHIGISIEPAGGSKQPTHVVMRGDITK